MLSLIETPRVKQDLEQFRARIKRIPTDSIRNECQNLYNQLENEVRNIDIAHIELQRQNKLPGSTEDSKETILAARKKLEKRILEYERVNAKSSQSLSQK